MSLLVSRFASKALVEIVEQTFARIDARWFSKDDVRAVIDHKAGTQFRKADYKRMNDIVEGNVSEDKEKPGRGSPVDDLPFRLPPMTAIAGVLLRDWVDGKLGFGEPLIKGNL